MANSNQTSHYVTAEGLKKLKEEHEYLISVRRPQVAEALRSAIDEGDLSENAGYEESKREQAFLEGRILELDTLIHQATILDEAVTSSTVIVGSRVTITEEGRDAETYQIVGRAEADPLNGRISNESPIGKALLGAQVGDTIEVKTPGGALSLAVIQVE